MLHLKFVSAVKFHAMFSSESLDNWPPTSKICLDADEIHIWRARSSMLAQPLCSSCIDDGERQRAERLRMPGHRAAFSFVHAFKRTVLGAYLEKSPGQLSFDRAGSGKPQLCDQSLQFNLSHTGDAVIMAVSRNASVGIDLESRNRNIDESALAAACLSVEETHALDAIAAAQRKSRLLQQWTRKEALLKALGTGLAHDPCKLNLGLTMDGQYMTRVHYAGQAWLLTDIALGKAWLASIAFEGEPKTLRGFCLGW